MTRIKTIDSYESRYGTNHKRTTLNPVKIRSFFMQVGYSVIMQTKFLSFVILTTILLLSVTAAIPIAEAKTPIAKSELHKKILRSKICGDSLCKVTKDNYCPKSVDEKFCHKVIVVGAGMAGLGAANELKSHGYDVIVLDDHNKVGGRVHSDQLYHVAAKTPVTIPVEFHASWIVGINGNPIKELADKYGARLQTTDDDNATYFDENGPITDQTRIENMSNLYDTFKQYMSNTRDYNQDDMPLWNKIKEFIENQNLTDTQTKDFLFEISSNISNEYGYDPSRLSLLYWDQIGEGVGGDDQVFLDGYDAIPKGLAKDLGNDVIYKSTKVQNVTYNNQGVKVGTTQGTFYGKYVIITIPINVLQSGSVLFTPPLPQNKIDVIHKMQSATLAQTYIYFENEPFWNNTDWINYIPPTIEEAKQGHWTTFLNMHKINQSPVLLAFNYGDYARHLLLNMTNRDITKDLLKVLDKMYLGKATMDTIIIAYRGELDSYSTNPVNFKVPDDYDLLASPVSGSSGTNRIFFAGEATTWHYPQTTHGAFLTGLREANRVMVTDTGKYPLPSVQEKNWRYPTWSGDNTWATFPEYIMCKPPLVLKVGINNTNPTCALKDQK